MALLFMDGFDARDFVTKWSTASGGWNLSATTRFGVGSCIYGINGNILTKTFAPSNKIIMGFAFNPNSTAGFQYNYLLSIFGDSGTTQHLSLTMHTIGQFAIRRGHYEGAILATGPMPSSGWHYVEISATIADSGGTVVVKVDGNTIINYSGDTKNGGTNTTIDRVTLSDPVTGSYWYFDDFYLCNDTGTTNNDFLGDVRVITAVPTAAGSATDLTPTGGANYANVADIPDSTATFNSSVTVGHKDLYTMGDIPASVTTIHAVQANNHAWKTDAGTKSLKNTIKSGATTAYGATISLPSSVGCNSDIFETDPATSTTWTVSGVNGVEAGAEVA